MRFYFVRHATTDWNEEGRYQGHHDIPLNEKGKSQVRELAARLRAGDCSPAVMVTSDLKRAVQTARLLKREMGEACPIVDGLCDERWRELDFGRWASATYSQLVERGCREDLRRWYDDPWRRRPPGGESLRELTARVKAALRRCLDMMTAAGVTRSFVVSHGGPIRAALSILDERVEDGKAFWDYQLPPSGHQKRCISRGRLRRLLGVPEENGEMETYDT